MLLALLIVLLVAFPAEIFNSTYEKNEDEIHEILARVGWRRRQLPPKLGLVTFAVVGAALSTWLALDEGSRGNPLAVAVGLLVAVPAVTFAFRFPEELYSRARSKIPGTLHVLPSALVVAVLCALLSRALRLHPAYLYGLFAAFAAARAGSLSRRDEGRAVLAGTAILASVAVLCWWSWGLLDATAHGPHRDWLVILASTALFWIFVLAAESLVFTLMPLRFLEGAQLKRWHLSAWLSAELVAAGFFAYVLMLHGTTTKIDTVAQLIRPLSFFVAFGLFSFAFWGYFRWSGRPSARMLRRSPGAAAVAASTVVDHESRP